MSLKKQEQLQLGFEQSDEFKKAVEAKIEAELTLKIYKKVHEKTIRWLQEQIWDAGRAVKATCAHPKTTVTESFDYHKRETDYTETCDACGMIVKSW